MPALVRSEYADEILNDTFPFGVGITGWAVEHRRPVLSNQAHLDPRVAFVPGTPIEPEALIVVPLIARGVLKGTLNVYRIGEDASFSDTEFELAQRLGDAAALALDNAHIRARLEREAQTDSLTGLYNHRYFHERLRRELTHASAEHEHVAVVMIDIDDFKKVNDVFGHAVGDEVLAELADHLRATVRSGDVVCRIGGEEFAVIVPGSHEEQRSCSRRRLARRLDEVELDLAGRIAVSIGIAQGPEHAANPRELVACAEAAMMTAKARGKSQVVFFDDSDTERPAGRPDPRGGHPLDRAPEDAPVARRQAQPLERRPRDRHGDRERAAAADRLPQLPRLHPRRRGADADRVPGRADRRTDPHRAAGLPHPRRRGADRPRRRDRAIRCCSTTPRPASSRSRSRAPRRSRSRSSPCRSTTAPA